MPKTDKARHFFTKARGVSQDNADGTRRQEIIRRCKPREALVLVHDPGNPKDIDVINICRQNGQQIGYLVEEVAEEVSEGLRQGYSYRALLANITGRDQDTLGVNLLVVEAAPGASRESVDRYVSGIDYADFDKTPLPQERRSLHFSWWMLGCLVLIVLGVLLLLAVNNGLALQRRPASEPADDAAPTAPAPSPAEPIPDEPVDPVPPEPEAPAQPAIPESEPAGAAQPRGLLKGMTGAEVEALLGKPAWTAGGTGSKLERWGYQDGSQLQFADGVLAEWKLGPEPQSEPPPA